MYRALSYLSDGTGTVDEFATPFGFRWFSWSASQGFSLNGAHNWIQGANLHQDHAGWGNGVSDAALYPRREDGQGRRDELHPWFALPEGAGLCGRLRPARPPVLVGEQLLGWLRRCGRMALQRRVSEHVRRFRRVRCQRPREPHGHDPHPSQSPEHHRVEHGQRGLLQRWSRRQGRRAAQEVRRPHPPARSRAHGAARGHRRRAGQSRRRRTWHAWRRRRLQRRRRRATTTLAFPTWFPNTEPTSARFGRATTIPAGTT